MNLNAAKARMLTIIEHEIELDAAAINRAVRCAMAVSQSTFLYNRFSMSPKGSFADALSVNAHVVHSQASHTSLLDILRERYKSQELSELLYLTLEESK